MLIRPLVLIHVFFMKNENVLHLWMVKITSCLAEPSLCLRDLFSANNHYDDVIMIVIASQITTFTIVFSTVYSDADQRKHQSSASLAFVQGIHRGPVNSPHKWPVTRKMFPFGDVIMLSCVFMQASFFTNLILISLCMLLESLDYWSALQKWVTLTLT